MNRFKCPACGGNQYTACSTAEWCIYCGHKELKKMATLEPEESEGLKMTLQAQEIKRLKNEVEKLKADLRGKDNEINDLKALVDYLRQFRPSKEENYNSK